MIKAEVTAEKRPACDQVSTCTGTPVYKTHKDQGCIQILIVLLHKLLIILLSLLVVVLVEFVPALLLSGDVWFAVT